MGFLEQEYFHNTVRQYLWAAGVAVATIVAVRLVRILVQRRMRKLAAQTETALDDLFFELIASTRPLVVVVLAVCAGAGMLEVPHRAARLLPVLATAVPLSRLAPDPTRPSRLVVTGQPGPGPWQAGPLVAVVAFQGFEADVPAGWEVRGTWKGLELRPVAVERRLRLARPVQMDTGFLESYYNPAPNAVKHPAHADPGMELPRAAVPAPVGRQSRGSFPGGRGWFRADSRDGPWRSTRWDISWPYRCEPGVRCPALLALRTLRVAFTVEEGAAAQAAGLAEHLLRSARPVANAVAGQAHAPRQDCVDGRHLKLVRHGWPWSGTTGRRAPRRGR